MMASISSSKFNLRQLFWFGIAGFSAFSVDAIILTCLIYLGMDPRIARIFSIGLSWCSSWAINRTKTFRMGMQGVSIAEAAKYAGASLMALSVNMTIFVLLVTFFSLFRNLPVLALVLATACSMMINLVVYSRYVFRSR